MTKVGFVGWRGMVGSVLLERMQAENDFQGFEPLFFTTSQKGQKGPEIGVDIPLLMDAHDLETLQSMDVIVTCQGSDYTNEVYPRLLNEGWKGYWIDAASALRMDNDSVIVLDPVNRNIIDEGLENGIKKFIGGNCTVSLMLMALGGLFQQGCIEWLTSMTYQAASGAGAKNMRELVSQMGYIGDSSKDLLANSDSAILELDQNVLKSMKSSQFPKVCFGAPLAGSALPWIDTKMENGQSREEWKGFAETNKILKSKRPIQIDGICVRIGAMRCHSQALTIKLNKDMPIKDVEDIIQNSNEWVKLVANEKEMSLQELTQTAVTGTLTVPVGRIRKLNVGPEYLTAYTVGDQLLWGAAEPLRRMLKILLSYLGH